MFLKIIEFIIHSNKYKINELSRYERSTIAETTRQITSKIFHNNIGTFTIFISWAKT